MSGVRRTATRGARLLLGVTIATLVVLLMIPVMRPVTGLGLFVVRTGSMTPVMPVGTALVSVPASTIPKVGQVITFHEPGAATDVLVTHRVYSVEGSGATAIIHTKGDANNVVDPWVVTPAAIVGHVVFHVERAGYVLAFISTWPVRIGLFVMAVLVLYRPKGEGEGVGESTPALAAEASPAS